MKNIYLRDREEALITNNKLYYNEIYAKKLTNQFFLFFYFCLSSWFVFSTTFEKDFTTNFSNTNTNDFIDLMYLFLKLFLFIKIAHSLFKKSFNFFNLKKFNKNSAHFQIKIRAKMLFEKQNKTIFKNEINKWSNWGFVYFIFFLFFLFIFLLFRHKTMYSHNFLDIENLNMFIFYNITNLFIILFLNTLLVLKYSKYKKKACKNFSEYLSDYKNAKNATFEFKKTISELVEKNEGDIDKINDMLLDRKITENDKEAVSDLFNIIESYNKEYEKSLLMHKNNKKISNDLFERSKF